MKKLSTHDTLCILVMLLVLLGVSLNMYTEAQQEHEATIALEGRNGQRTRSANRN
jgi:hypothetical protein